MEVTDLIKGIVEAKEVDMMTPGESRVRKEDLEVSPGKFYLSASVEEPGERWSQG